MLNIWLRKKSRKYPIKRDEYGRSAWQRAFEAFDAGKRPAEVTQIVQITLRTACRYFADWKKLPTNLEESHRLMKAVRRSHGEFSAETIKMLATYFDMPEEEVIARLQKPWGLKQLLMGKWPNYAREERKSRAESRLEAALQLVGLVEHTSGMTPKEIRTELGRFSDQMLTTTRAKGK